MNLALLYQYYQTFHLWKLFFKHKIISILKGNGENIYALTGAKPDPETSVLLFQLNQSPFLLRLFLTTVQCAKSLSWETLSKNLYRTRRAESHSLKERDCYEKKLKRCLTSCRSLIRNRNMKVKPLSNIRLFNKRRSWYGKMNLCSTVSPSEVKMIVGDVNSCVAT